VTVALALLAGIAFAISVQGGQWWVIDESTVGPFGGRRCFDGTCDPAGLAWIGAGDRWMRIGIATWTAGMIALFVLVVLAAAVAAKRVPRLAAKTALVAIATAMVVGGLFFAQFPSDRFPSSIGRGVWVFVIAIVLGSAAAISVLRVKR